jgi:hypothetical protein
MLHLWSLAQDITPPDINEKNYVLMFDLKIHTQWTGFYDNCPIVMCINSKHFDIALWLNHYNRTWTDAS